MNSVFKTVTAGGFAMAAAFAVLSASPAAGQVNYGSMPMPDACGYNQLNKCSLQIWARDSFPHAGVTQYTTFTNGRTLTCTSNGPNTIRTCNLSPPRDAADESGNTAGPSGGSQGAAGSGQASGGSPAKTPLQQCVTLRDVLTSLAEWRHSLQPALDGERGYLARAMQMSPAMIDSEIQRLQTILQRPKELTTLSGRLRQSLDMATASQELDYLRYLRGNQALGSEVGDTPAQMQAKADKILNGQAAQDKAQDKAIDQAFAQAADQIDALDCKNLLPSAFP